MYPKKNLLKGNLFINIESGLEPQEDAISKKVEDDVLKPEEAGFLRGAIKGNVYGKEES